MEKMRMESVDGVQLNVAKIAALFPNCITETKDENGKLKKVINFDILRQMLSGDIIQGDEAYELTWVGKKAAIVEANKPVRMTLRPCPEESVNWDSTKNLYIEGDNLNVLKLLQESYLGKIRMIYIDPPYNTGHDFVYPDSFIMDNDDYNEGIGYFNEDGLVNFQRENGIGAGKYHSDWCSMIYSRLVLARNLLSNEGFIAISIGEEEVYNLIKICNEVFGEANFRNIVALRRYDKNINLQFASNGLSTMNVGLEYVLIYSKNTASKMVAVYKASSDDRSQLGYTDLVAYLKSKKHERQIIVVTHNANVVVGADAEEVIIANQHGKESPNREKRFEYRTGAIENTTPVLDDHGECLPGVLKQKGMQEQICDILEGGRDAFELRRKKYIRN